MNITVGRHIGLGYYLKIEPFGQHVTQYIKANIYKQMLKIPHEEIGGRVLLPKDQVNTGYIVSFVVQCRLFLAICRRWVDRFH